MWPIWDWKVGWICPMIICRYVVAPLLWTQLNFREIPLDINYGYQFLHRDAWSRNQSSGPGLPWSWVCKTYRLSLYKFSAIILCKVCTMHHYYWTCPTVSCAWMCLAWYTMFFITVDHSLTIYFFVHHACLSTTLCWYSVLSNNAGEIHHAFRTERGQNYQRFL